MSRDDKVTCNLAFDKYALTTIYIYIPGIFFSDEPMYAL